MRPCTETTPLVGFVIPATTFNAVLLPDPFRPMTPYVAPFGTANDTSVSAGNVSFGCSSRRMLRCKSALLSVANCLPPYLRYTFETCESSIAGVTRRGLPGTTKDTKKYTKNAKKKTTETRRHGERQLEKAHNPWRTRRGDRRRRHSAPRTSAGLAGRSVRPRRATETQRLGVVRVAFPSFFVGEP